MLKVETCRQIEKNWRSMALMVNEVNGVNRVNGYCKFCIEYNQGLEQGNPDRCL